MSTDTARWCSAAVLCYQLIILLIFIFLILREVEVLQARSLEISTMYIDISLTEPRFCLRLGHCRSGIMYLHVHARQTGSCWLAMVVSQAGLSSESGPWDYYNGARSYRHPLPWLHCFSCYMYLFEAFSYHSGAGWSSLKCREHIQNFHNCALNRVLVQFV